MQKSLCVSVMFSFILKKFIRFGDRAYVSYIQPSPVQSLSSLKITFISFKEKILQRTTLKYIIVNIKLPDSQVCDAKRKLNCKSTLQVVRNCDTCLSISPFKIVFQTFHLKFYSNLLPFYL